MAKEIVSIILKRQAFTLFYYMSREDFADFVILSKKYNFNVDDYMKDAEAIVGKLMSERESELSVDPLVVKQIMKNSLMFNANQFDN